MREIATIVSWLGPKRGYGFAKRPGLPYDLYFHQYDVLSGEPAIGRKIECEILPGVNGRKPRASKVKVL